MPATRRFCSIALVTVLALGAAACSDDETASTSDTDGGDSSSTSGVDEATTSAPSTTTFTSERYSDPASWVCRPDIPDDPCTTDLDYTVLNEDGSTEVVPHEVASDPAIDCFYLYPTVNISAEGVAGFDGEYGIEIGITRTQAARLSRMCRMFAPLYEQATFGMGPDVDQDAIRAQAYADVEEAFRYYLANDNDGRPFVLLGHSQGSGLATRLLQDHVDGDEQLRSQLVSALLIGTVIMAPEGKDVGGTFENLPACRASDQTGCIVTYASYYADDPPGDDAGLGRARDGEEGLPLCTNPAALGGGSATLQMIDPTGNDPQTELGAPIDTPYVALPDFVSGECVTDGDKVYLAITVNAGDGPRADTLRSDTSLPWGLHPIDYNLTQGDLVDLVEAQAAAFTASD
jgi:Protein of unknown function (DUF3089)